MALKTGDLIITAADFEDHGTGAAPKSVNKVGAKEKLKKQASRLKHSPSPGYKIFRALLAEPLPFL
jgi:hypothetical protein